MTSQHAVIETDAIGARSRIGEFAVIRAGAVLGDDVTIHPHAIVESGVTLEDGVEVFPHAYVGRPPTRSRALTRQPRSGGEVRIGTGTSVGVHACVWTDVVIGPECLVGDYASIREQSRIGSTCLIGAYVGVDRARVGDRTKLIGYSVVAGEVGADVFVALMVGVAIDNSFGRSGQDTAEVRGPTIRDRAAVGVGANLLPVVQIGYDAIVGAGSLVTKDVEDGALVMGVPARPVPRRSRG